MSKDRAADADPRPVRVMVLDVPDGPQYRLRPAFPAFRFENGASGIKIVLLRKPLSIFVALNDPNRACRLTLKCCVKDDRDLHVRNLLDEQDVRNGRYHAGGLLPGRTRRSSCPDRPLMAADALISVIKQRQDAPNSRHLFIYDELGRYHH
jgi:hypothetical protein